MSIIYTLMTNNRGTCKLKCTTFEPWLKGSVSRVTVGPPMTNASINWINLVWICDNTIYNINSIYFTSHYSQDTVIWNVSSIEVYRCCTFKQLTWCMWALPLRHPLTQPTSNPSASQKMWCNVNWNRPKYTSITASTYLTATTLHRIVANSQPQQLL